MSNQVGFNITSGNLPSSPSYSTLQEIFDAFASELTINLDEEYGLFKIGASAPDALTQVAWLKDSREWYVVDASGNWVPASIDTDYKRVYVQNADPTTTETSVSEQSLWVEVDTDGTTILALKVYLSSSWRTVGFTKSQLDVLDARVDSVIETTSPYGLKEDVVGFSNLSDAAINSLQSNVLQAVYPVGSLFLSTVSTNPADLLGFGTWSLYGEGRALVGAGTGSGLTARTLGSTFGSEEVTLTSAQSGVPAHTHPIQIPKSTGFAATGLAGDGTAATSGTIPEFDSELNTAADAASAHTNMQPSIAINVFRRVS